MSFTVHVKCKNIYCNYEFTDSIEGNVSPSEYCSTKVCPHCGKLTLQITGADFVK